MSGSFDDDLLGQPIREVDTPALVLDLDALDHNVRQITQFLSAHGKAWRPHAKCHKSVTIGHRLLDAGAIGLTVAKLSEAELFARAGIRDLLIAHYVVGRRKLARLVALRHTADPIVCCDHFVQAESISEAMHAAGLRLRVLVEINLGLHRTGVRPGPDTWQLVEALAAMPGIDFAGIMGYEGHLLTLPDLEDKRDRIVAAMNVLVETATELECRGYPCRIVSAGGTGSYQQAATVPGVTEMQAGGVIFADPFYTDACRVTGLQPSLSLLSTVVSRPKLERAVLDCGRKSLSDAVFPSRVERTVTGRSLPDAAITMYSAEHLTLELGPESRDLLIGEKVLIRPGYSDMTTVLHDRIYGVRNERVTGIIPLEGRGCLT